MEISLSDLRRLGWRVLVASVGQITLTIAVGYGIGAALGWDARASLTAGLALSLSSTMVALKTLNDRGELGTLHGRLAAGMLLVQDLAFVPMMAVISALGGEGESLATELAISAGKAAAILAGVWFVGSLGLPWLLKRVALVGARESFVVTVMAAALGAAALTSWAGLSAPLGAFVAGLVLSESDWAGRRALSEVIPVRDVFAALFFVSLGMLTDLGFLASHLIEVALFIGASVVVKLFLIYTLTRALGYLPDTAARTGSMMIQIGEFSFIVAGTAVALGVAGEEVLPLIITAAVVTMGITPGFVSAASKALGFPANALHLLRAAPCRGGRSGVGAGARPRTAGARGHRGLRARGVVHRTGGSGGSGCRTSRSNQTRPSSRGRPQTTTPSSTATRRTTPC